MLTDDELARMRIEALLALPDQAVIYTPVWAADGVGGGTVTFTASSTVACRLDPMAIYRGQPEIIGGAEGLMADYIGLFPYNAQVVPNQRIVVNGGAFEVRGVADTHSWRIFKRMLLVRLYP